MKSIYLDRNSIVEFLDKIYNMLDMYEVTPSMDLITNLKQEILFIEEKSLRTFPSIAFYDVERLLEELSQAKSASSNTQSTTSNTQSNPSNNLLSKWQIRLMKRYKLVSPDPRYNNLIVTTTYRNRKYITCDYKDHNGHTHSIKVLPGALHMLPDETY
jgi:hypothetical protein